LEGFLPGDAFKPVRLADSTRLLAAGQPKFDTYGA
jgi:hypothetical protein